MTPVATTLARISAISVCTLSGEALAQTPDSSCPINMVRWTERCDPDTLDMQEPLDRLRHISLSDDNGWFVKFGGQARLRFEDNDDATLGLGPQPELGSTSARALAHADLRHSSGYRVFGELSVAETNGRDVRPFDESGLDVAQLFVEAPVRVGETQLTLRLGRQELPLAGNSLVGLRDGVVLRRSFDAVRINANLSGNWALSAFHAQPVLTARHAFDDSRDRDDKFTGVTADKTTGPRMVQAFAFWRSRPTTTSETDSGRDERLTAGVRFTGTQSNRRFEFQGAGQVGHQGEQTVRAWGLVGRVWVRPRKMKFMEVGLSAGAASGDGTPGDTTQSRFDPIYPNLGVFAATPLYYPTNQINVSGSVGIRPTNRLRLVVSTVLLARLDRDDSIYGPSGRALAPSGPGRLNAITGELEAIWSVTSRVELRAVILSGQALRGVRRAGGDDPRYAMIQLTSTF